MREANARLYDPALGRFLSPDPYVQMPGFTQNFNRYSYCLNNPLIYTDPSGEKWWHWFVGDILTGGLISSTVAITGLATYATVFPMTNQGYELQKYISPIAVKPNFMIGSDQNGLGFDVSIGMNKGTHGYRYNFGATYYFSSYGGYNGWETRRGGEWELLPLVTYSSTKFSAGGYSQTIGMFSLGDPLTSIKYENDFMFGFKMPWIPEPDGGDRFRTAAVQMTWGPLSLNLNIFTGDPGMETEFKRTAPIKIFDKNGKEHLAYSQLNANNPNQRAGVLSFGFGPLRIGRNSEQIRHVFQNRFAHDFITGGESYWFMKLPIRPSWYWSFGSGSGNTLW